MRKFVRYTLPLVIIAGSIGVVVALVAVNKGKRPEQRDEISPALLVDVIRAEPASLNLTVRSQGSVQPRTETTVMAEVSGKIVDVSRNFIPGGFLRKGEVLLRIDASDYEAALKRAEANLASRRAQLADQQARSDQALRDWANLGRSGEPSELTLRKPQLAEAMAAVQAAEADLEKAQRDLDRTRIRSPYDGLVRSKLADVGQYVSPGTPLGMTFAIETAEVRLPITIRDLAYLQLPVATGAAPPPERVTALPEVKLTATGSGIDGAWRAQIVRTEGIIDEASRVIYAVAEIIDPYGVLGQSRQAPLRVGTFVSAEIEGIRANSVVVLPRSVLRPDNTLLIADDSNRLEIRPVQVLRSEPNLVYLTGGVGRGDRVISTSLDAPIAGTLVSIGHESEGFAPATGDLPVAGLELVP